VNLETDQDDAHKYRTQQVAHVDDLLRARQDVAVFAARGRRFENARGKVSRKRRSALRACASWFPCNIRAWSGAAECHATRAWPQAWLASMACMAWHAICTARALCIVRNLVRGFSTSVSRSLRLACVCPSRQLQDHRSAGSLRLFCSRCFSPLHQVSKINMAFSVATPKVRGGCSHGKSRTLQSDSCKRRSKLNCADFLSPLRA
jgi:hypothetical protein